MIFQLYNIVGSIILLIIQICQNFHYAGRRIDDIFYVDIIYSNIIFNCKIYSIANPFIIAVFYFTFIQFIYKAFNDSFGNIKFSKYLFV